MNCRFTLSDRIPINVKLIKFSWEQRVPKSGSVHDAVVTILNDKGLRQYAACQKDLRNAVVNYLQASIQAATVAYHVQSNHLWNQAISTTTYPPPDGDGLAYDLNSSRLLLPNENRADEAFVTGRQDGADGTEVFGQDM
jgi:hypothetical protein